MQKLKAVHPYPSMIWALHQQSLSLSFILKASRATLRYVHRDWLSKDHDLLVLFLGLALDPPLQDADRSPPQAPNEDPPLFQFDSNPPSPTQSQLNLWLRDYGGGGGGGGGRRRWGGGGGGEAEVEVVVMVVEEKEEEEEVVVVVVSGGGGEEEEVVVIVALALLVPLVPGVDSSHHSLSTITIFVLYDGYSQMMIWLNDKEFRKLILTTQDSHQIDQNDDEQDNAHELAPVGPDVLWCFYDTQF